jgi:DNA polymerase III sliding clamp (beta) subunit (PCNA family)
MKTENTENAPAPVNVPTPERAELYSFRVPAYQLRAALSACAPAMSKDPLRMVLNAVCLELSPAPKSGGAPFLTLWGTDGRRAHGVQLPLDFSPASDVLPASRWAFVLPSENVKQAIKGIAKKDKAEARVCFYRAPGGLVNAAPVLWISIQSAAGETRAKAADVNFPDMRRVIPSLYRMDGAGEVSLPVSYLRAALGNIQNAQNEARLTCAAFGADVATLNCDNPMSGRAAGEALCKSLLKDAERDLCHAALRFNLGTRSPAPGAVTWALNPAPVSYALNLPAPGACQFDGSKPPAKAIRGAERASATRNTPAADMGLNPAYVADALEAFDVLNACPGFRLDGLDFWTRRPKDINHSWDPVELFSPAFDRGREPAFVAVIMPQRLG